MILTTFPLLLMAIGTVFMLAAATGFYLRFSRFEDTPESNRRYIVLALCSLFLIGAGAYLRSYEHEVESLDTPPTAQTKATR